MERFVLSHSIPFQVLVTAAGKTSNKVAYLEICSAKVFMQTFIYTCIRNVYQKGTVSQAIAPWVTKARVYWQNYKVMEFISGVPLYCYVLQAFPAFRFHCSRWQLHVIRYWTRFLLCLCHFHHYASHNVCKNVMFLSNIIGRMSYEKRSPTIELIQNCCNIKLFEQKFLGDQNYVNLQYFLPCY